MDTQKAAEMTIAELADYVRNHSETGDPDISLEDWLSAGDLDGMTADDVVADWDSDRE
jgi:hypothetical protein